jgi:predicted transcriptional regulator YdeE
VRSIPTPIDLMVEGFKSPASRDSAILGAMSTPNVSPLEVPATTVVGVSGEFISALQPNSDAHEVISALWGRLMESHGHALHDAHWAVGVMSDVDGSSAMKYLAAIRVEDSEGNTQGLETVELAGGSYLACEHVGSLNKLGETTAWFYTEYLPTSGVQLRDDVHLEIYDDRFDPESKDSIVLICAPV